MNWRELLDTTNDRRDEDRTDALFDAADKKAMVIVLIIYFAVIAAGYGYVTGSPL